MTNNKSGGVREEKWHVVMKHDWNMVIEIQSHKSNKT